jgi:hypothetical protein
MNLNTISLPWKARPTTISENENLRVFHQMELIISQNQMVTSKLRTRQHFLTLPSTFTTSKVRYIAKSAHTLDVK